MEVVAFRTEQGGSVGGDGVGGGIGRCDHHGAADSIYTGIGNAGGDEFALYSERAEVVLDRCIGIVALPVNGVDADATMRFRASGCLVM